MDGTGPVETSPPPGQGPENWVAEFRHQTEAVRRAAAEWAVRWDEPEGRFISALLGAVEIVGKLTASVHGAFEQTSRDGRIAAESELLRAKELHRAAQLALTQIRNIELAAKAEHEAVAVQMIDRTLPLFIERLEKVLVIREQRWNKDVERRRYAAAGAVVLAIFLAGFGMARWEDHDQLARMDSCLIHPIQASGHYYCRIDAP